MLDIVFYLFMIFFLAALAVGGALLLRAVLTGASPVAALFGNRRHKRLDVIEHANVDGRRKLLLVRRDDVEHLIMTGGPVDVVIETGIKGAYIRAATTNEPAQIAEPVFFAQATIPQTGRSWRVGQDAYSEEEGPTYTALLPAIASTR